MTAEKPLSANGSPPCLEFRSVSFRFRYDSEPAIDGVSFTVEAGEFVALLGPNGSGKTTLIKLALGLVTQTSGVVALFGQPPGRFREWERVGYVPQRVEGIVPHYPATAEEVVAQGLYRGFDPAAIWRRSGQPTVLGALETAGIADLRRRKMSALSGGQQQRALIARALVREPDLLILDEPVAGVDVAGQEQLYAMLRRLNAERGLTVLLVTHDIGAVMREATTVACINRSLVFHGPAHAITQRELSALYGLPMDVLLHDALHEHR